VTELFGSVCVSAFVPMGGPGTMAGKYKSYFRLSFLIAFFSRPHGVFSDTVFELILNQI
jgi:hypothetical protein